MSNIIKFVLIAVFVIVITSIGLFFYQKHHTLKYALPGELCGSGMPCISGYVCKGPNNSSLICGGCPGKCVRADDVPRKITY